MKFVVMSEELFGPVVRWGEGEVRGGTLSSDAGEESISFAKFM
jgi:hypothetical protein